MGSPRVLFLTRFTEASAYTRYRVCQYLPAARAAGFDCVVDALFPATYLARTYYGRSRRVALLGLAPRVGGWLARRVWSLLRARGRFDVIFLQYEALPYLPLALELALLRSGARLVVDFDDAVHLNYERHPSGTVRTLLGPKIAGLAAACHGVITANRHLADWARGHNPNVAVIPNAVDVRRYGGGPASGDAGRNAVVGWIGTPITAKYLRLIEGPLRALSARHDYTLKVIGAPGFRMDGVTVNAVPWAEATEADDLRACDVGIMPLPDDPWARGKSALKLLQYMAAGVAAVASPVGANCDVLTDGRDGLFAATDAEWVEKLSLLIRDAGYRRHLALAGRRTAEEQFSVEAAGAHLVGVLAAAAAAPRR